MTRRGRTVYFPRVASDPAPLRLRVKRRVRLSEVDPLGIVWFGHYARFFEEATAELSRRCGLGYRDFLDAELLAPIVRYHVDYLEPLLLDEECEVGCAFVWNDGARLDVEHEIVKATGAVAARGCSVQMFLRASDRRVCLLMPPLLERCRQRWRSGELRELQP
jgi:acyl-CoA thioester hydrolase